MRDRLDFDRRRPRPVKFPRRFGLDRRVPEALQGGPQWPEISRLRDTLRFPGRCGLSGWSACRIISALIKKGIDPRSKTPYIANRREGPRF